MKNIFIKITLLMIIALGIVSCVPVKRIAYVQSDTQSVFYGEPADIRIKPGDEIYVRITSADEQPVNFLGDGQQRMQDARLMSYIVSEDGKIKLPYVGRIDIGGLTIDQASDRIEERLAEFLYLPSVFMRFMNTRVTVMGEVARPGVYMFDYKNINVLQAVALAGDITEFGNRRKVLIIRENGGNRYKYYVDLTKGNILESEMYNITSGDIVYIEPLGRKKFGLATVPYNLILSLITTGLFVYTFVQNNLK